MTQPVSSHHEGGCACHTVRYTIDGPLGFSFHCQCRSCQYLSGTGHASAFIVKEKKVAMTGELRWYERQAPSGNVVTSGFCTQCGTTVLNKNTGYPDNLYITATTLDNPAVFKPSAVVHRDEGHAWDFVNPEG